MFRNTVCTGTIFCSGKISKKKPEPKKQTAKNNDTVSMEDGPDRGGPRRPHRLMIQKMVLENFKSYGGTREIGPFHKRFSSIVGPNGSGKSNVIDAMLFVFGKRAKKLRLNKVSELIHRSEQFPNVDRAKVSVYMADVIDDGDEDTIVEGSEVVVSRTALLNNSSKYSVDGVSKTFAQVAELLRSRGIDLENNRFLILQGEVEQIAMMKPKGKNTASSSEGQQGSGEDGLLEYLEDIIGSNSYLENIEQAGVILEAKVEARTEKLHRLKVTEHELETLDGPKREAELFVVKEDEIRRARSELYQTYAYEATIVCEETEKGQQETKDQLDVVLKDFGEREKELENAGKTSDSAKKALQTAENLLKKKTDDFTKAEAAEIVAREETKHRKAAVKKLKTAVTKAEADVVKCTKEMADAESKKDGIEAERQKAAKNKDEADAEFAAAQKANAAETKEARDAVSKAQRTRLGPATTKLNQAKTKADAVTSELDLLQKEAAEALKAVNTAASKLATATEARAAKEEALDEAETLLASKKQQKDELEARLNKGDVALLEETARQKSRKAARDVETARAELQRKEALSKTSGAVRAVLAEASSGRLKGVRGRLGDLGFVDPKYDVAASTASDMLDYVVVETAASAQACIAFLRAKNLGRASFVALSELDQWRRKLEEVSSPRKTKAPRLFDLVTSETADLRPAFYLAFRDTLVATTLDAGVELAYKGKVRNRVVTLEGHLFDTAGTMTGGGGKPKSGKMRLSSEEVAQQRRQQQDDDVPAPTAESIGKLEAVAKRAAEELQAASAKRSKLETELRSVKTEMDSVGAKIPRLKADVDAALKSCGRLEQRLEELRTDAKAKEALATEKLKTLGPEAKDLKKNVDALEKEVAAAQKEVEELRAAVLEAGGTDFKKKMDAADAAREKLTTAEQAAAELQRALKSAQRGLSKAESAKSKAQADLEALENKEDSDIDALASKAASAKEALDEATATCDERRKDLHSKVRTFDDLQRQAKDLETKKVELQHLVDDLGRALQENRNKHKHWAKELSKLRSAHSAQIRTFGDVLTEYYSEDHLQDEEDDDAPMEASKPKFDVESLEDLTSEELAGKDQEEVKYRLALLEGERDAMRSDVNVQTIDEYREKKGEYDKRLGELDAVTDERNKARDRLDDLKRKRKDDFMIGFGAIALKLKEMYQMITLGGDAELELVDSLDPFAEGVVFSVRPPKKSWKHISNLSGGEKTLSSLALVFALHHYKPTPLYVMDEIDAALDFKNVSIIANYIATRCKSAQFIIISLRNQMFELADRLVGIYKTYNVTKTITIAPDHFAASSSESQQRNDHSTTNILHDSTNSFPSPTTS